MKNDVFISYKSEDLEQAKWLKENLEYNGINCWMAAEGGILNGEDYAVKIPKAISQCRFFVLVLSKKAQKSKWIPKELDCALNEKNKIILPFRIENCKLTKAFKFYLTNIQTCDAYKDMDGAAKQLIKSIRVKMNHPLKDEEPVLISEAPESQNEKQNNKSMSKIVAAGAAVIVVLLVLFGIFSSGKNGQEDISQPANNTDDLAFYKQESRSMENAMPVDFDKKISAALARDEAHWYKFTTAQTVHAYQIKVFPTVEESDLSAYSDLKFAVYDNSKKKIKEYSVNRRKESGFIDCYLEPQSEYFVKVYGESADGGNSGSYDISITETVCDAGYDKNSSVTLTLDTKRSAVIDSTLSDWYVFKAPEAGKYRITVSNVNSNGRIQVESKAFSTFYIKNKESYYRDFDAQNGELVYVEIHTYNTNPVANGDYVVMVEKSVAEQTAE